MKGDQWRMAKLPYGAGLRLHECLSLRVKDLDFGYRQILVREGEGGKDRITLLPRSVVARLASATQVAWLSDPVRRALETQAHARRTSRFKSQSIWKAPPVGLLQPVTEGAASGNA